MAEALAEQIIGKIEDVAGLYHRLVIVAAPPGAGKTASLQEVSKRTGYPRINVNLELSRRLLELTRRQRSLHITRLLGDIVSEAHGEAVLLDNIEILFDVDLNVDPLRCLQALSRNRTIVVAWNGTVAAGETRGVLLTYATPDHREFRRCPADDLVIASPGAPGPE